MIADRRVQQAKSGDSVYQNIVVVHDGSKESEAALRSAIRLARTLGANLTSVTWRQALPAYTAYAQVVPEFNHELDEAGASEVDKLLDHAHLMAKEMGVTLSAHSLNGGEDEVVSFLNHQRADLLVLGLHPRSSRLSRLWSHVYTLAQNAPCSVLGVH